MANVAYPPFFPAQILDGDGQPVANGAIRAAFAGSDVPAPLFTPDGTALGSSVTLNSSGEAVFCLRAGTAYKLTCLDAQGATVWVRDNVRVTTSDSGMANPMEAQADMIVGAVDGQPERLAAPSNASFLRSYKNSDNVPVIKWSQLKAGANVTITDAGTQVTVAADTQTGDHKVSTDGTDTAGYLEDKLGAGSGISLATSAGKVVVSAATQPGDHKIKVNATDSEADYLRAKVHGGTLVNVNTETDGSGYANIRIDLAASGASAGDVPIADGVGGAVFGPIPAQTGDHQLLVSATDAAAGYLGAKLTAGANVTLTPQTDGDGVQTLEISATGGGGGVALQTMQTSLPQEMCETTQAFANQTVIVRLIPTIDFVPTAVRFMQVGAVDATKKIRARLYCPIVGEGNKVIYDSGELTIGDVYGDNTGSILPLNKITTYTDVPVLYAGSRYYIGLWTSLTNVYRCHSNNYNQYNSFYSTSYIGDLDTAPLTTFNPYYPSIDVFGSAHFS